jgi:putative phosphoribosyl transferase
MEQRVRVAAGRVRLAADLAIPAAAKGVVLFAHGSGSGRLSPRNRLVAATLQQAGLATLLLDLLTAQEEKAERAGGRRRFDLQLLASRLAAALDWLATQRSCGGLPVGLFGASTGVGAALLVAADRPAAVAAVVSRGGRPDLAGAVLGPRSGAGAHLAGGRRPRPEGVGAESGRPGGAGRPGPAGGRGRRQPPVPGARGPGARRRAGRRLVPRAPGRGTRLRAGHLLGPADHRPKTAIAR